MSQALPSPAPLTSKLLEEQKGPRIPGVHPVALCFHSLLKQLEDVFEPTLELRWTAKFCNAAELVGVGIPVTVYVGEEAGVVRFAEDHLGMIIVEVHLE